MIDRASPQTETAIPLSLGPGNHIVGPGLEPVLGWYSGESNRSCAQALVFPGDLLEPCATQTIAYACVLPGSHSIASRPATLQINYSLSGSIARQAEPDFLSASFPGGQIRVVLAGGAAGMAQFRWACVSTRACTGAVWRCFVRVRGPLETGPWTAVTRDYVFKAGTGLLLTEPGSLEIGLGDGTVSLLHPGGRLVCFPSGQGRVKVTGIYADGWARRELKCLMLHPDRAIAAHFDDGTQAIVATSAIAHAAAAIAA
jgi:hypothetical protein